MAFAKIKKGNDIPEVSEHCRICGSKAEKRFHEDEEESQGEIYKAFVEDGFISWHKCYGCHRIAFCKYDFSIRGRLVYIWCDKCKKRDCYDNGQN